MKNLILTVFVCILILTLSHANAASKKVSQNQAVRSYIDPFSAMLVYEALAEVRSPEVLALPQSSDFSKATRLFKIGDNIVTIRPIPPRSPWKPSR